MDRQPGRVGLPSWSISFLRFGVQFQVSRVSKTAASVVLATCIQGYKNGASMNRNRFLPGNDGHGGGRPLGSRNKLQGDFLKALAADFAEHGAGVIKIARIEKPVEYLKVITSVLSKEVVVEQSVLSDISDDELAAHI